ncbi:hypothetical protein B484DRAFT_62400 [Ochromonadaceae sp. CCMP2298]|nr:hypothetical protein B484DRAFT_62400 [Ochromonadaceae sp. CCMP2298]|mmetsp:Transcript_6333/g.13984  ORF Transcript_6333/g.13984 Transcript_6333/m.13984 type:complete len:231 (-) Transcript_6333:29-721(-)
MMVFQSYTVLLALSTLLLVNCFCNPGRLQLQRTQLPSLRSENGDNFRQEAPVVIEIAAKRTVSEQSAEQKLVAYNSAYADDDDDKEDIMTVIMDSPVGRVVGVVFNPMMFVTSSYVVLMSGNVIFQTFKTILTKLGVVKKDENAPPTAAELDKMPYQIFECEVCQIQLRPAKGRAESIFGRERFRCSRCGSKAESYFNIDDMEDVRAVDRKERLEQEAAQQLEDDYGDEE